MSNTPSFGDLKDTVILSPKPLNENPRLMLFTWSCLARRHTTLLRPFSMPHSASKSSAATGSNPINSARPTPFYCHTCGRHTSHSAKQTDPNPSPENAKKHCSQRCKNESRASSVIGLVWREMLDEGRGSGKDGRVVLCADVQERVFDESTGRPRSRSIPLAKGLPELSPKSTEGGSADAGSGEPTSPTVSTSTSPPSAQALGMLNASNRELVRRSARLLVHFGFPHLAGKKSRMFPLEWETEAIERLKVETRDVKGVGWDGKVVEDVTHQKGEWGLKWKAAV